MLGSTRWKDFFVKLMDRMKAQGCNFLVKDWRYSILIVKILRANS